MKLLLLRQTTVPTVIDSFYLLTLGSYRAFYILNWVVRYFGKEHFFEPITSIFGVIQTAFYVDFAWVYWTRQRVKLRNGGVVDSDDLGRGWLVSRLVGRQDANEEEGVAFGGAEDGERPHSARNGHNWRSKGLFVSADDHIIQESERT
ncbi:MAG: hypothetical protein LQ342_000284 [Letrouitia transgressa]|nr:MAG: hypothetical protein LQ342_000284 [Letrouitia transgressa]